MDVESARVGERIGLERRVVFGWPTDELRMDVAVWDRESGSEGVREGMAGSV